MIHYSHTAYDHANRLYLFGHDARTIYNEISSEVPFKIAPGRLFIQELNGGYQFLDATGEIFKLYR